MARLKLLEGFCEDLAHRSQLQLGFWRLSHMGHVSPHMGYVLSHGSRIVTYELRVVTHGGFFSHRCSVLKATIWDAARSAWVPALIGLVSTYLSVFNLSVYHLIANPIACASFPRLTHLSCR